MVDIAARQLGLIGARMTGGGFGGCTINLVEVRGGEQLSSATWPRIFLHDRSDS